MNPRDRIALLYGPYRAPALRKGDRSTCFYRDCEVVVTSWTDAPIPWPRCRSVEHKRSAPGLLVDDELLRAIRHESAAAVIHWWRVTASVVWCWRRAFQVTKVNNKGSNRLVRAAAVKGAAAMQAREFTQAERDVKRQLAIDNDLQRHLRAAVREDTWTAEEIALLGQLPDAEVARKIGRTVEAVRLKRMKLGLSNPTTMHWTAEESALLGTMPDDAAANRLGRSVAPDRRQPDRRPGHHPVNCEPSPRPDVDLCVAGACSRALGRSGRLADDREEVTLPCPQRPCARAAIDALPRRPATAVRGTAERACCASRTADARTRQWVDAADELNDDDLSGPDVVVQGLNVCAESGNKDTATT
jgi:hypothetical protein